jgi:lipoprotein-releasing system permease protein
MGATNWQLRKVFLVHFGKLILKGMLWGNVIGVGFCLLQAAFHIVPLDPKIYYLDAVPISISALSIIGLNVITLIVCLAALLVPSYLVAKIAPSKAMRMK